MTDVTNLSTDSMYELHRTDQRERTPKPVTPLREILKSSKRYSSTALGQKDCLAEPTLKRQVKLQEGDCDGAYSNSTIETNVQELECPGYVNAESLNAVEERKKARLGKVKDGDDILQEGLEDSQETTE